VQGSRYRWSAGTGDVRALESSDELVRRAAVWYHPTEVQASMGFVDGYVGMVRLYAVDWDTTARRQLVTVDDGSGPQTRVIDASFNGGAWVEFGVVVPVGGTMTITVTKQAGGNAVLSGIFLG